MPQYLDPQQIFPKRMGLMNGNTLVLEYYHLGKDKFKKHLIPYDVSKDPKTIVEDIYKNPKHAPYLKRVNPKNVRLVLEGNKIQVKKDKSIRNYDQFPEGPNVQENIQRYTAQIKKQNQPQPIIPQYREEKAYAPARSIDEPKPQPAPSAAIVAEPEDYYEQQFQDFEVSASMDKPSNISSSLSKVDPPYNDKTSSISKSSEPSVQPPKKQKEVPVVEEAIEDDFDFLDEDQSKKKKKEKKNKSKDKKSKKEKGDKKAEKKKEVIQNNTVEDQFQFL